jgi:hypothetical protein
MRVLSLVFCLTAPLALAPAIHAQTTADSAAVRATALDYIEGYYNADTARMARALHPDLVKRIVQNGSRIQGMTAAQLVRATGSHPPMPEAQQVKDVTILDIYRGAAAVKVNATDWIDYMQLGRIDGQWKIIYVLWELKPKEGQ